MRKGVIRSDIIRTKIKEMEESIRLVEEHLPDTFEEFSGFHYRSPSIRFI